MAVDIDSGKITVDTEVTVTANEFDGLVEEVTLNSDFYPIKQPFIATIKFSIPTTNTASGQSTENILNSFVENLIDVTPQNQVSLTHEKTKDGLGPFTLSLFDPGFSVIRKKIEKAKGQILFQYGYFNSTDKKLVSPLYVGFVQNYDMKFTMNGAFITFYGITLGYDIAIVKYYDTPTADEKISDVVKKIAGKFHYETDFIEPTADLLVPCGVFSTAYEHKKFNWNGETNLQFILQSLASYAVNDKGQRFNFFIKITKEGKKEFHFHSVDWEKNNPKQEKTPAFTMFSSPNSALLDFRPNWEVSTANIWHTGETAIALIDAYNKEQSYELLTPKNTNPPLVGGDDINSNPPDNYVEQGAENNFIFYRKDEKASNSRAKSEALASALANIDRYKAFRGSLDIVGNPNFNVLDQIAVIVYTPKQDSFTSIGQKNHDDISGYFFISKITEKIEVGKYITTFELGIDTRNK